MIPRRTIAELRTRYKLEPELADVYVEGVFDKQLLKAAFSSKGENSRAVYNIDTIDISRELLDSNGLSNGNKQRVICFARSTADLPEECRFRCLVDKDLDEFLGSLEGTKRLVWTKFASIELCFFSLENLEKILITFANCSNLDLQRILDSSNVVLKKLFAFRLTDRDMGLHCKWPCPKKNFSLKSSEVTFDEKVYLKRLLSTNSIHKKENEFLEVFENRYRQIKNQDVQQAIRGHDFTKLLAWKISKSSPVKDLGKEEIIRRLYMTMTHEEDEILFGLSI